MADRIQSNDDVERSDGHGTSYVEHVSAHAFAPTLVKLEESIARVGFTIFARIDHAAAAREVGLTMPPATVLLYGNPRGGTPIMLATPRAALDLPLRVLIREDDDGRVLVGFHPIDAILQAAGVASDIAARLVAVQTMVIEGLRP